MITLSSIDFVDQIVKLINNIGIGQGLLVISVCVFLFTLAKRFNKFFDQALDGKQKEIDRLTEENDKYRNLFLKLLNDKINIKDLREDKEEENDNHDSLDLSKPPSKQKNKNKK